MSIDSGMPLSVSSLNRSFPDIGSDEKVLNRARRQNAYQGIPVHELSKTLT
ncbi:hypothetical protein PN498_05145 [Oscillatoria sp. CS-180]|uniref:hypothetical protein n=1 Tax=Oscillatoria sp. CS-180 TaxID=3021720 RepID=UPI0023303685|nr:hypothetical protein [Oscillatoria sp. CS-180]MDB9525364.1 hypothetical protein [Oscillatoria sp. CS-180]